MSTLRTVLFSLGWLGMGGVACLPADAFLLDDAAAPDVEAPDGDVATSGPDAFEGDAEDAAAEDAQEPDAALEVHAPDVGETDAEPDTDLDVAPDVPPDVPVEPNVSTLPADLTAAIEAALAEGFEGAEAPGAVLGVVVPGEGVFYGATGLASVEPPVPAGPSGRYRAGSVTKTFTAALVLELAFEGALDLDTSAAAHIPAAAATVGLDPAITLRQLLAHTAGLFDFTDDFDFLALALEPGTPEEVLTFALSHPPVFAPGQGYSYSNSNFFVLGLVLEAVTGEPYAQRLRERLLDPLALADTFLDDYETLPGGTVTGHLLGSDASALGHMSWAWAAGAIASNPKDLCAWMDALVRGDVLVPAARTAMLTPTKLPNGGVTPYGLGLQLTKRAGRKVVGHNGLTVGFTGEVFLDLESGVCVASLLNDFFGEQEAVTEPVWQAVFAWLDAQP